MAKKVIHYLKSTTYLGLIYNGYPKNEKEIKISITPSFFKLIRYEDNSYTKDFEDR